MLGDKPFSTQYITQNYYYNLGTIKVSNIVLHSVGVGSARTCQQWRDSWNKSSSKNNVSCVVTDKEGIIMLPCLETSGKAMRCAGCGAGTTGLSFNSSAVQIEMSEYKDIKYVGGATFKTATPKETAEYQLKVLDTAIQFMANICIFHNLNPLTPGVIVSHHEGHVKWNKSSNHGDCDHLFNQLPQMNMTMDKVRQLVAERVEEYKLEKELNEMTDTQFDKLMESWQARQAKKSADNWAKEDMEWAKKEGLFAGDGTGTLMPQSNVNRQTLAALLSFPRKIH